MTRRNVPKDYNLQPLCELSLFEQAQYTNKNLSFYLNALRTLI